MGVIFLNHSVFFLLIIFIIFLFNCYLFIYLFIYFIIIIIFKIVLKVTLYYTLSNFKIRHDVTFGKMHTSGKLNFKGACSEIFAKWVFFTLADIVTFPTKTSSMVKKIANIYLICSNFEKTKFMLLLFL